MKTFECTGDKEWNGEKVRCHQCLGCRTMYAWVKSLRIHLEALGHTDRVWLCTLTFATEVDDEVGYPLVQKWLKAVRIGLSRKDGSALRYTCVCERGSRNNRLHYHLVVYSGDTLKWRMLDKWEHGHSHFKLVSGSQAAKYVLKYLSKGHGKVRSSIKLGVSLVTKAETVCAPIFEAFPGAKIVRIGPARVPRELGSPVYPPADPEWKTWTRENSTAEHPVIGMSDQAWDLLTGGKSGVVHRAMSYEDIEKSKFGWDNSYIDPDDDSQRDD